MIISKCGGDRKLLHFELEKLENYSKNGKKITTEIISKLTNLTENHDITELIDLCLANEKKRTLKILTENTFSNEDSILILKLFLNKLKKILELSNKFEANKDINLTISLAKPPIFWKKKEITKKQILNLESIRIKKMIYELYDLELKIKKNFEISLKLMTDFIMNQFQIKINN